MEHASDRTVIDAPAPGAPIHHLKLRAETPEDIIVFSAVLQDAVAILGDMAYRPAEHRFALMVNRYLWEQECGCDKTAGECYRIRTGVHFDGVLRVSLKGLSQRARKKILELLSITFRPEADGAGVITLIFAGGGAIQLHVECIDAYLSDRGEPWRARCRPLHSVVAADH